MGKCVSASLDLEDDKASNTDAAAPPQVVHVDSDHDGKQNAAPSTAQTAPNNNVNMGSLSESEDDETEPAPLKTEPVAKLNVANENVDKAHTNHVIEMEKKEEKKIEGMHPDLRYIEPTEDELAQQEELPLAHISHRGHYLNGSQWSAQNVLQRNESHYVSLKGYHFNPYDPDDTDWIILKICSNDLFKVTSLTIDYAMNTLVEQYPAKISVQFLSENSLNKTLSSSEWTKPYMISPNPLCTEKPKDTTTQHSDTFNIALSEQYLNRLRNKRHDQYIRVSFVEAHNDNEAYDGDNGKYAVHYLRLSGVHMTGDDLNEIRLENTVSQQTDNRNYKVDITNNTQCKLSPKPGPKDARVMMREHIFFVSTESKTILQLKQAICDEYNRFVKGTETYQPKQLLLIEGEFGLVNDLIDCTVLNKTLSEIGATTEKNNGYYITVAFC